LSGQSYISSFNYYHEHIKQYNLVCTATEQARPTGITSILQPEVSLAKSIVVMLNFTPFLTIVQQGSIKLIKTDSDFYSYEVFLFEINVLLNVLIKNPEKKASRFPQQQQKWRRKNIFKIANNVSWAANQNVWIISEGLCHTNWSNVLLSYAGSVFFFKLY